MRTIGLIFGSLVLAGCTTVANGPMQRIVVESNPPGAIARFTRCGAMATKTLTTPGVGWVSRRSTQCRVIVSMANYPELRVRLTRHVSRNIDLYSMGADEVLNATQTFEEFVGAATFILLPSFAVDAASGSMFELQPNRVYADLAAADEAWRKRQ